MFIPDLIESKKIVKNNIYEKNSERILGNK